MKSMMGIQVKIRVFEPDSRQIREITVVHGREPRNTRSTRKMAENGEQEPRFPWHAVVRGWRVPT